MPPRRAATRSRRAAESSDVEEEEQEVTASRSKGKQRAQPESRPAAESYLKEPLNPSAAKRLQLVNQEANSLLKHLNDAFEVLRETAEEAAEGFPAGDDEGEAILAELDKCARDVLDSCYQTTERAQVINVIRQDLLKDVEIPESVSVYDSKVAERIGEYTGKTARQKYGNSAQYKKYQESVWNTRNPEQDMPTLKLLIETEPLDEDDSDEELEIGAHKVSFKDPISLRTLEDPLTSVKCKHSVSAKTFWEYFEQQNADKPAAQRNTVQCPMTGCRQLLTKTDMQPDPNLKKRVERYLNAQARNKGKQTAGTQRQVVLDEDDVQSSQTAKSSPRKTPKKRQIDADGDEIMD